MTMKTILTDCRHGKFLLLRGDMISQYVQMYGEWCEAEVELYQLLLKPTDNVAEIGCNIGLHTVPLAKLVHQGKVFAFEPQRIIYNIACANIALNNINNTYIFNKGASDSHQQLTIEACDYEQGWNYGAYSIDQGFSSEQHFPVNTWQETCEIVALDEVINEPLHFLKIDAEGYESKVLDGCDNIIKRDLPFIFVENNRRDSCDILINKITSYGYQCFWFISPRYRKNNFFCHYLTTSEAVDINMLCVPNHRQVNLKWLLQPATNIESLKYANICY